MFRIAAFSPALRLQDGYRAIWRVTAPLGRSLRGIRQELWGGWRWTGDASSRLRYAIDVLLYRALSVVRVDGNRHQRTIRLATGQQLVYRLDRGDIRVLAEVLTLEPYRLPTGTSARTIVDLGCHIGVTSVWLAQRYGARNLIAVEPSPSNARIARINLALNGIKGSVIEAAVAASDGWVRFDQNAKNSTVGRVVATGGQSVRALSMPTILGHVAPGERIELLKFDTEGGEAALFSGDLDWLERVDTIIGELHPHLVDVEQILQTLRVHGFRCIELDVHDPHWLFGDVMALFVRERPFR